MKNIMANMRVLQSKVAHLERLAERIPKEDLPLAGFTIECWNELSGGKSEKFEAGVNKIFQKKVFTEDSQDSLNPEDWDFIDHWSKDRQEKARVKVEILYKSLK